VVGRSERVVPTPVLKHGHDPSVGESPEPGGGDVAVLRTIGHHYDQLSGIDLDGMLSPIQRATLEHRGIYFAIGGSHTSDDAIARRTFTVIRGGLVGDQLARINAAAPSKSAAA
jgi:hypothetical protein